MEGRADVEEGGDNPKALYEYMPMSSEFPLIYLIGSRQQKEEKAELQCSRSPTPVRREKKQICVPLRGSPLLFFRSEINHRKDAM